jgi:hypothetical protein
VLLSLFLFLRGGALRLAKVQLLMPKIDMKQKSVRNSRTTYLSTLNILGSPKEAAGKTVSVLVLCAPS